MSAPPLDAPTTADMPLEVVEPVRRHIPVRRPPSERPPFVLLLVTLLAAALSLVAAVVAGDGVGEAFEVASGTVLLDGTALEVGDTLPYDVQVKAGTGGGVIASRSGRVSLTEDTVLSLDQPRLGPVAAMHLAEGSVLVEVADVGVTVDATVVSVTGQGTFRVDRGDTVRVATYIGLAAVRGDRQLALGRLSQVRLDGGAGDLAPIALDPDDPWDAQHAAGPLATDVQVAQLALGLETQYGTLPQTRAFYEDFVGVTEGLLDALPRFAPVSGGGRFGPPAQTLVAAASIESLLRGTGRPLDVVVAETLDLRAAGGTWGVILAQQDLDAAYLRTVADEALERRAERGEAAEPVIRPVVPSEPTPTPTPSASPTPTPTPTSTPTTPRPTEEPTEGPTDPPTESPGPLEDPIGTIGDLVGPGDGFVDPVATIEDLIGGLVGGVGGQPDDR